MQRSKPRPTLLVFTLAPGAESARRRLTRRTEGSSERDLYAQCLRSAISAGSSAGCDIQLCTPSAPDEATPATWVPQGAGSFKERLSRAVESTQANAHGDFVVVGSDTPELSNQHIEEALSLLARGRAELVLGPAPDGGTYLIAASRRLAPLLREVRWRDPRTLESLIATAQRRGWTTALLEPLDDLDERASLERWLARARRLRAAPWETLVAGLLAQIRHEALVARSIVVPLSSLCWARSTPGRAPPA